MNLKDFATPLKAEHHFIKASFGGFQGSGKTRTASEFIKGCYKDLKIKKPLLVIDNEKGLRFLIPFFEQANIKVLGKETNSLADIIQAMDYLNSGEIGFLFIDSLTKVWYRYVADYKKKNSNKAFMTLQDWGKILPAWQSEFSDRFVEIKGNILFTGRGGYTYDMEEKEQENGQTKKEFVKSGVKMKMAGETPFETDLNIWMTLEQEMKAGKLKQWREAQILKDRSGTIDGKTFKNPTYKDFKPLVDFIQGLPIGDVSKVSNSDNLAPTENYDYLREKEAREIAVDKFDQTFKKYGYNGSTSKDNQRIGVMVLEKVFDTKSSKEVEKKWNAYQITKRVDVLDKVLNDLSALEGFTDKETYIKNIKVDDLFELEAQTEMKLN